MTDATQRNQNNLDKSRNEQQKSLLLVYFACRLQDACSRATKASLCLVAESQKVIRKLRDARNGRDPSSAAH